MTRFILAACLACVGAAAQAGETVNANAAATDRESFFRTQVDLVPADPARGSSASSPGHFDLAFSEGTPGTFRQMHEIPYIKSAVSSGTGEGDSLEADRVTYGTSLVMSGRAQGDGAILSLDLTMVSPAGGPPSGDASTTDGKGPGVPSSFRLHRDGISLHAGESTLVRFDDQTNVRVTLMEVVTPPTSAARKASVSTQSSAL